MLDTFQPLTIWLHSNPQWGLVFAFLVSFTESLAIVGAIVPGSVTLTFVGLLIGTGVIPFWSTVGIAVLGAVAGDSISFAFGRYFRDDLKNLWPFRCYPKWIQRGEDFFQKHGGKSVFIGRFFGPIRGILPLVLGTFEFSWWRFLIVDILSGLLWAPVYLFPGIVLGAATLELPPEAATRVVLLILLVLVMLWLGYTAIKAGSLRLKHSWSRQLTGLWRYMRQHPLLKPLTTLLKDPDMPHDHGQLSLAIVIIICCIMVVLLTYLVVTQSGITQLNPHVQHLIQSFRLSGLDPLMLSITMLGDTRVIAMGLLGLLLWLAWGRHWRTLVHVLGNTILISCLTLLGKGFIAATRPLGNAVMLSTHSFPSGHSAKSAAILGFIGVILAKPFKLEQRFFIWVPLLTVIFFIGFSRLYLNVHWLTDVLGGWLLASLSVMLATVSWRRVSLPYIAPLPIACIVMLTLGLGLAHSLRHDFQARLAACQPNITKHSLSFRTWYLQQRPILPRYRLNRLGIPAQPLTIQWAGPLPEVRQQLIDQGWEMGPKPSLFDVLNRLATQHKDQYLPLLADLYQLQPPALTVVKHFKGYPLLIFNLWPSHYQFRERSTPLWIGTIHFRSVWQDEWLHKRKHAHSEDAAVWLAPILHGNQWRKVTYTAKLHGESTAFAVYLITKETV